MEFKNLHTCRHIETSKNALKLHGRSTELELTKNSQFELTYLHRYIMEKNILKIFFAPTPQCELTAKLLSELTGLPIERIALQPYNFKNYNGISHEKLRKLDFKLAEAVELFRYKILPYKLTELESFHSSKKMNQEIIEFFESNMVSLNNALVILSNSTFVKFVNYFNNILPTSKNYFNIGVANSGTIDIASFKPENSLWPKIIHNSFKTNIGNIIYSEYYPKISPFQDSIVIILPGIFGSSRFGPYNLFNRIARKLSESGFKTVVIDPIGSGESIPVYRTLSSEQRSLQEVLNYYETEYSNIVIISHSLSANILANLSIAKKHLKLLLAPILDVASLYNAFEKIDDSVTRHGLIFAESYFDIMDLERIDEIKNVEYFFGTKDRYVNYSDFNKKGKVVHLIKEADHNFSIGETSNDLIELINERVKNQYWTNYEQTMPNNV